MQVSRSCWITILLLDRLYVHLFEVHLLSGKGQDDLVDYA
jgi:hypothetical protein